jgi:hypothetical protein
VRGEDVEAGEPWPSTTGRTSRCQPASDGNALSSRSLPGTVPGVRRGQLAATRLYTYGVRVHNREGGGRLPELTESQLGRLEDEIRRERQRRASSPAAGERALPRSMKAPRCPSRKSWSTVPTRTATCSWSCAATYVVTAQLANADPTGTSSTTRVASVRSSTSARPATHRAP